MILRRLGWIRWAWCCLMFAVVGLAGCERTPATKSPTKEPSRVLAWVGKTPILEKDFLSRYLQSKTKQDPQVFLQGLIDEEILWQRAQASDLSKSRQVREETQKAMIARLLKVGFEKANNPQTIPVGLVWEVYNLRTNEFNQPVLLETVHVLASKPKLFSRRAVRGKKPPPPSPKEQALLDAEWKRRQGILMEILATLKAKKVRTKEEFGKAILPFVRKYNVRRPSVLRALELVLSSLQLDEKMTRLSMSLLLRDLIKQVPNEALCSTCQDTRRFLFGWSRALGKAKKPMSMRSRKRLEGFARRLLQSTETVLRLEAVPAFPKKPTQGFSNVVPPYAKAAYALKDGEFSQSPVDTDFGWHIIFRLKARPPKSKAFAEVEGRIRKEIFGLQKKQMFRHWLDGLLANHKAKIFLDRLKKVQASSSKKR